MEETPQGRRKRADWEAIERDYRTGVFSDHELADKHGNVVSRQAISKRAKEKGWQKDLTAAVRQATRAKVIADEVADRVAKQVAESVAGNAAESCQKTADVVEAAAEIRATILRRHKTDWAAVSDAAIDMLSELRDSAMLLEHRELLAQILAGEGAQPKDEAEARQVVNRALALGGRIASIKALSETFTKIQAGQRTAYGLRESDGEDDPEDENSRSLSPNDLARRIAFALQAGMRPKDKQ